MKGFLRYYKWELNNELFASIYFVALLSMYSIVILLDGKRSIDIFIMLEMLIVCYAISILQQIVFSDNHNYSTKSLIIRTVIWFLFSMFLVLISSILFHWFRELQTWALGAFMAFMAIFLIALWVGIHIANKIDTNKLNNMLINYQEQNKSLSK